jgi:hypothetical protein
MQSKHSSMSKTQKFLRTTVPILALGLLVPTVTEAGMKGSLPVRWNSATDVDFLMGSVRNSADTRQWAEVLVVNNTWAWFFAVDSTGRQASCVTTDANRIALARNVTHSSYVRFSWNTQGQCTSVSVAAGSYHEPPVR